MKDSIASRIQFLKNIELFRGVSKTVFEEIAKNTFEKTIRNGEPIYLRGEISESLFILRYGEVWMELGEAGKNSIYLSPGECFSEISLLTGSLHGGSAVAAIDSLLYVIDGAYFLKLVEKNTVIAQNVLRILGQRMQNNIQHGNYSTHPRRLITHISLETEPKFVQRIAPLIHKRQKLEMILAASEFSKMPRFKVKEKLSGIRKKIPVIHIAISSSDSIDNPNIQDLVIQSDYIVFWEKHPEIESKNKERILENWKSKIRNFSGRAIRFISDPVDNIYEYIEPDQKYFHNIQTLSRFLVSRTRGLALGGGAARALAHVGLIKVLEEEKIEFDFISGSSMGAVIAALYARKEKAETIERMVKEFFGGIESPFDPTLPFVSFFKGTKMKRMLRNAFGDMRIEELPIPFMTSAIDLNSGQEYIFDSGPVWEALICTSSLPGAFPPQFFGDKLLVDGGILNNVPGDLARRLGANQILGVNVSPLKEKNYIRILSDRKDSGLGFFRYFWEAIKYPPILKVMGRSITLGGREIVKLKKEKLDLFLNLHLEEFQLFDFHRHVEIMEKGYQDASLHREDIIKAFS